MGSKSIYLEKLVLDGIFGGATITLAPTLYIALFTTSPTEGNDAGVEVTGGSYARVAVTNNATNFPAATQTGVAPASKNNATQYTFPTASANWGTVTSFGIYDALTGGNLLYWGAVNPVTTVLNTNIFIVYAGNMVITET